MIRRILSMSILAAATVFLLAGPASAGGTGDPLPSMTEWNPWYGLAMLVFTCSVISGFCYLVASLRKSDNAVPLVFVMIFFAACSAMILVTDVGHHFDSRRPSEFARNASGCVVNFQSTDDINSCFARVAQFKQYGANSFADPTPQCDLGWVWNPKYAACEYTGIPTTTR